MGVDLKLLIVEGSGDNTYAHTMMEFGQYYNLFDRLNEHAVAGIYGSLSTYLAEIPDGEWEGESGYGDVTVTPYGQPLTYLSAAEFVWLASGFELQTRGRAAVAYLKELPADTWICLYYH